MIGNCQLSRSCSCASLPAVYWQLFCLWTSRYESSLCTVTPLGAHAPCAENMPRTPVPATTAGVFIGEAALTMIQNVDYEVPYLRKQMSKCSQQMADAERRHAEYVRSAAQCATNYKKVGTVQGQHEQSRRCTSTTFAAYFDTSETGLGCGCGVLLHDKHAVMDKTP